MDYVYTVHEGDGMYYLVEDPCSLILWQSL